MDEPVTRRELHEALDTWAGAIISQVTAQVIAKTTELIEASEKRTFAELARHIGAFEERNKAELAAIEERTQAKLDTIVQRYDDLPPRVSKLEAKVFAPRRKRASTKARRRG